MAQIKAHAFKSEDQERGSLLQIRKILGNSHSTTFKPHRENKMKQRENMASSPPILAKAKSRSLNFNPCPAVMGYFHLPTKVVSEKAE